MILDQLFEDDKKKKLDEVDPRNFDSDEDYYSAVRRSKNKSYDDDYDDDYEDEIDDDESYYEKYVRTKNLEESRQLNEAMLMEDPIYRKFKQVGRYIAERKMTEKEILDVFAAAEQGMTNTGTGANRTMLGRGKDTATKFAGNVSGAVKSVLDSMRTSVPVQAVEVAYDQATDALADVAGGQDGPVMNVLKQYRMLAKEYPKTTGLVRSALIMAAGMATGGAAPIAIIGALGALDRALKGNTLFNSLTGGVADSALAGVSQAVASAMGSNVAQIPGDNAHDMDMMSNMGDVDPSGQVPAADSLAPGEEIAPSASRFDAIVDNAVDYKVKQGDTLSDILADRKINPEAFRRLPGNEVFFGPDGNPNLLKAGQIIKLPDPADVADLNKMSYTTPSDPNLAKDFGNPDFYAGQYNQNSTSGLDAANNLKQQELGRWGSDNGMSAARAAKDAGGGMYGDNATSAAGQAGSTTAPNTTGGASNVTQGMPNDAAGADEFYNPSNRGLTPAQQASLDYSQRIANPPKGYESGVAYDDDGNLMPGWNAKNINGQNWMVTKESVKIKKLSADKLIDQKSTVLSWALNESVGRKSKSVNLTAVGTYTVFENVDRYRKALLEYTETGPGRPQLPDLYRPDMPDAPMQPADPAKKSWLGKGIDYLDKGIKKVGGALSNFGHQFTTNVTKEKLKMNWHQAGKPSDSDALSAWLVKQGVPQDVVTSVYDKMGIPYTAPAVEPTVAQPAATNTAEPAAKAKAQQPWGIAAINPETGKQWLPSEVPDYVEPKDVTQAKKDAEIERQEQEVAAELERERLKTQMQKGERQPGDWARARELANRTIAPTDVSKNIQSLGNRMLPPKAGMQKLTKDLTSPTPSFAQSQTQPAGFNAANAMNLPGMEKYAKPAAAQPAVTPNFARQNTGYSSVKMNAPTGIKLPGKPATPAVANAPRVVSGGPTPAERQALDKRIAAAAKAQPVAETVKQVKRMMETVTSKADVQRIKDYIDYHMGNNLTESARVKRNRLISEVTQLAATRRREIARRMAQ